MAVWTSVGIAPTTQHFAIFIVVQEQSSRTKWAFAYRHCAPHRPGLTGHVERRNLLHSKTPPRVSFGNSFFFGMDVAIIATPRTYIPPRRTAFRTSQSRLPNPTGPPRVLETPLAVCSSSPLLLASAEECSTSTGLRPRQ